MSFDQEHTPANPYCSDPSCWCHNNSTYHDQVQHPEQRTTEQDVEVARSFFGVSTRHETRWGGAR